MLMNWHKCRFVAAPIVLSLTFACSGAVPLTEEICIGTWIATPDSLSILEGLDLDDAGAPSVTIRSDGTFTSDRFPRGLSEKDYTLISDDGEWALVQMTGYKVLELGFATAGGRANQIGIHKTRGRLWFPIHFGDPDQKKYVAFVKEGAHQ